jgi:hypothetical protein
MQINTIPVADTEARSRIIPFIAAFYIGDFVFLTVYLYSQYYALHSFLSAHQPVLLYSIRICIACGLLAWTCPFGISLYD